MLKNHKCMMKYNDDKCMRCVVFHELISLSSYYDPPANLPHNILWLLCTVCGIETTTLKKCYTSFKNCSSFHQNVKILF